MQVHDKAAPASARQAAPRALKWRTRLMWAAAPVAVAASWLAVGATTPPAFKPVALAAVPLYTAGSSAKPTLTLALSVEFPTVGAQYRNAIYSNTDKYIGYFDSESCYRYDVDKFVRSGAASARQCSDAFSGNFMNWASSSSIDILRLGLTGGDRVVDSTTETVLQRAFLPAGGTSGNFWNNDSYFPSKKIDATQAAGALPVANRNGSGDTFIANCKNKIYFGTAKRTNSDSCADPNDASKTDNPGDNGNRGDFLTRVRVCDSTGGVLADARPTLCVKYPNGNFKPVGNLQKYSDNVRIAAFGYLMENGTARYGGVLRASMRYVGSKNYDTNGALISGTNPNREWDDQSGEFRVNPETAAEGNSGVINYLNKFGRIGVLGQYKSNDPVSELYYESLRYVQGLGPTDAAIQGPITDTMKAGFPYAATWTDPHAEGSSTADYSCVNNNILAIGDVFTHADKSIPGNSRTGNNDFARAANPAANEPDFHFWSKVVGGFESNRQVDYTHSNGTSYQTGNLNSTLPGSARWGMEDQGTGSGGSSAYYMAGMAYWAHTHDIRGSQWSETGKRRLGMRATTFMLDVNENSASSTASNRHNNQYFLAAKYGGFNDISGKGNPFLDKDGALSNAGWEKNGEPGEAKTYFLSSSAQAVLDGLDEIFKSVAAQGNNIAGAAISSQNLTAAGGYIYNASFNPDDWSGNLIARPVTANGNEASVGGDDTAAWKAAEKLDARDPASRNIIAGSPDGNTSGATATPFKWESLPDSFKKNLLTDLLSLVGGVLGDLLGNASATALGQARVAHLQGDKSREGTTMTVNGGLLGGSSSYTFRSRTHLLGDIVNSAVTYSGAPTRSINATGYASFYETNKNRAPAVFVGANDGMLHAFDASNGADGGKELFAYIPSWLAPDLADLSKSNYGKSGDNAHRAFVDGSPTVGEAQLSENNSDSWKTVLVSGTGAGGQGVFALDVTNPKAFSAASVLWEFSDKDDADMGNVIGKPQLQKFKIKPATATTPAVYKWFAVVASGVNNYVSDDHPSETGKPALFLLALDKPAGTKWTAGSNYFKLSIPVDATLSATVAPGLVNFTATGGPTGEVAQIYMGDLHGRLWKLDFSLHGSDSANWSFNNLAAYNTGTTSPRPLFVAKDNSTSGLRQPITMAPTLIAGPKNSTIVIFGTGKYLEPEDNQLSASTQIQSVYALFDDGDATSTAAAGASLAGRSALVQGVFDGNKVTMPSFTWGRPSGGTSTVKAGWYFDFASPPTKGERQINDFAVFGKNVIFGSLFPPGGVTEPCATAGGNMYTVDFSAGKGSLQASTVGLLSTPIVAELADARSQTVSNNTGRNSTTRTGQGLWIGAKGIAATDAVTATDITRRLSWRLIENYRELKNATP